MYKYLILPMLAGLMFLGGCGDGNKPTPLNPFAPAPKQKPSPICDPTHLNPQKCNGTKGSL